MLLTWTGPWSRNWGPHLGSMRGSRNEMVALEALPWRMKSHWNGSSGIRPMSTHMTSTCPFPDPLPSVGRQGSHWTSLQWPLSLPRLLTPPPLTQTPPSCLQEEILPTCTAISDIVAGVFSSMDFSIFSKYAMETKNIYSLLTYTHIIFLKKQANHLPNYISDSMGRVNYNCLYNQCLWMLPENKISDFDVGNLEVSPLTGMKSL